MKKKKTMKEESKQEKMSFREKKKRIKDLVKKMKNCKKEFKEEKMSFRDKKKKIKDLVPNLRILIG